MSVQSTIESTYVAVWSSKDHWNSGLLEELHHLVAGMVRCIVQHDERLSPPSWILLVELLYQVCKVQLHHGGVGVGLY